MELPEHLENLPDRVHLILDRWTSLRPDSPALEDGYGSLTYKELREAVEQTAAALTGLGVGPGDRVLVVCENCVAACVFFLAASRLDAWVSLVNARLTPKEIAGFVDLAEPKALLFLHAASAAAGAHARSWGAREHDWRWVGSFFAAAARPGAQPETAHASAQEQVCALVFTSGTFGVPKAVMLTHQNLMVAGANYRHLRDIRPQDRVYGVLPLSHVYGLTALLIATLYGGAALVLEPRFSQEAIVAALGERGITMLHGVPAMYAKLLEATRGKDPAKTAPHLRVAQSGGAPLGQSIKDEFEAFFGVLLNNGYGMTENSPSISHTRLDSPRKDTSVGVPVPAVEVMIDDGSGREAAAGTVGEILVRGPTVMKGYYRDEELTAQTVTTDGWLKTGDLGRRSEDGGLHVVGRKKELIIRSGFNVYPSEVEGELNSHPQVVQAAVVGRAKDGDEEIIAFVEPSEGATVTASELLLHLKARLSPYKIPKEIIFLERMPSTGSGKILKQRLKEMAAS